MTRYEFTHFAEVKVTAKGTTGHSLILHENTAAEKLQVVINRLLEFRSQEKARLESNSELTLGDVTSVNMTMLGVCFLFEKKKWSGKMHYEYFL